MPEQIRTFIAIELSEAQKRALGELQARFKRSRGSNAVRWVTAENIHLTLKFLGAVDSEKMSALHSAIAAACSSTPPFILKLGGVGAFPNLNRPNVVWVGIQGDVERAARLAQNIDDACAALGFPRDDRAFSPHLTLGRVKRDARPSDRALIGEMIANAEAGELGDYRVERVSVMKSDLRPGGSVYTRLNAVELGTEK